MCMCVYTKCNAKSCIERSLNSPQAGSQFSQAITVQSIRRGETGPSQIWAGDCPGFVGLGSRSNFTMSPAFGRVPFMIKGINHQSNLTKSIQMNLNDTLHSTWQSESPEHELNTSTPISHDLLAYAALLVDEDLAGRDQELWPYTLQFASNSCCKSSSRSMRGPVRALCMFVEQRTDSQPHASSHKGGAISSNIREPQRISQVSGKAHHPYPPLEWSQSP